MDGFKLNDLKEVHVGNVEVAKKGLIDSITGEDTHRDEIPFEHLSSYKKGHEVGSQVINLLKCDQEQD
jgi:hypothetical protein